MQSAGDSIHAQRPPRLQLHTREPHGSRLRHHERAASGASAVRRHATRALQRLGGGGLCGSQGGVGLIVPGLQGHVHQRPEGVRYGVGAHRGDPSQGESEDITHRPLNMNQGLITVKVIGVITVLKVLGVTF